MDTRNNLLKQKIELAVEMNSPCCAKKVENALKGITDISSFDVNFKNQRVVLEGQVVAENVRKIIEAETGISAVIYGQGSVEHNLGAGVAAINFGNQGILGMLRFIQKSPNQCHIEGTIDNLPVTKTPLFMTVQATGDLSKGMDNCGSLLTNEKKFSGIISELIPDKDHQAEFQITSGQVELWEMIGHCVCVHQGSEQEVRQNKSQRLACGLVARASGLFENTKKFCACDGKTIWEQRKSERDLESNKS